MAHRKHGASPHTKYRHARQRVAELEAQQAKLERSRPRTPGKKGAKTRALNGLARQLRSARGQLTKARSAIAKAARSRSARTSVAKQKRSTAAKKGWATRRARTKAAAIPVAPPPTTADLARFMPFLTEGGVVYVNPAGADRSLVGKYWSAVGSYLETGSTDALDRFDGKSIVDLETGQRLPFVTDPEVILDHEAEFDFGPSFYKRREEVARFAA